MVDGTFTVTSASNPWIVGSHPWTSPDVGLPIYVDAAESSGLTLSSTITSVVNAGEVVLNHPNSSGSAVVGGNVWWGAAPMVTDGAMDIGGGAGRSPDIGVQSIRSRR